jgi:hypothetical protein
VFSVAAAGVIALALSGCTGAPEPTPTPSAPTDAAEPIFASDEEALAAAEAAYERYLSVSAEIGADAGEGTERVLDVATAEYAAEVISEFEKMSAQGLRVEGANTLDTTSLLERSELDGRALVSIYGCVGVGTTQILDEQGNDLTPVDRDDRVPLVLSFESDDGDGRLLVAGSDSWSGDDFC